MTDFLEKHWSVITANSLTFVMFAVIVASGTFAATRILFSLILDASRERLEGAKDEVARLRTEKDGLVATLQAHGASISDIKAALESAPKIRVSQEPPDNTIGKDGDIWIQTRK